MKAKNEECAVYNITRAINNDDATIARALEIMAARMRTPGECLNSPKIVLDSMMIVGENANHASQKRQTRKVDIREHKQTYLHLRLRSVCASNDGAILSRKIHAIHHRAPDARQTPWPLSWRSSRSKRLYLDSFANTSAPHKTRICKTSMASYGRTPWTLYHPRRASPSSRYGQTQRQIGQPCFVGYAFSRETPHARSDARHARSIHLALLDHIIVGGMATMSFAETGRI